MDYVTTPEVNKIAGLVRTMIGKLARYDQFGKIGVTDLLVRLGVPCFK